jgi:hypothetical protein
MTYLAHIPSDVYSEYFFFFTFFFPFSFRGQSNEKPVISETPIGPKAKERGEPR